LGCLICTHYQFPLIQSNIVLVFLSTPLYPTEAIKARVREAKINYQPYKSVRFR
jgi:hypothetical protein